MVGKWCLEEKAENVLRSMLHGFGYVKLLAL